MSNPSRASSHSSTQTGPRVLLWVVFVLSALLLGSLTGLAVRNNPLNSDVARNKISKYRFIEECKDQLNGQLAQFERTQGGTRIGSSFDARDLVSGTSANPQMPGWVMASQVKLSRPGFPTQSVPFSCRSDAEGHVSLAQ